MGGGGGDPMTSAHSHMKRPTTRLGQACTGQGMMGRLCWGVGEHRDWGTAGWSVTKHCVSALTDVMWVSKWRVRVLKERFAPSWTAAQPLVPVTACLRLANIAAIPWALKCSLSAATNFLPFRGDQMFLPKNISFFQSSRHWVGVNMAIHVIDSVGCRTFSSWYQLDRKETL